MTASDVYYYWVPAANALFSEYYQHGNAFDACKALQAALGIKEFNAYLDNKGRDLPMTEELKQLCVALAGPHGRTVLKAYQIKRGLKCSVYVSN